MYQYRIEHRTGTAVLYADSATDAWAWCVRFGLVPMTVRKVT